MKKLAISGIYVWVLSVGVVIYQDIEFPKYVRSVARKGMRV